MSTSTSSKRALSVLVLFVTVFQSIGGLAALAGSPSGSRIAETGSWTEVPAMNHARCDHTMHVFENDSIMVIGGFDGASAMASVEVYNPFMGQWLNATPMHAARWGHASVALVNKSILVMGGYGAAGNPLKSAELFEINNFTWYTLPDMPFANGGANLTATMLTNGSVLVVGGNTGPANAPNVKALAAIFDAKNNTWSSVPAPFTAAMGSESFLLGNHTVLVTGGSGGAPWYKGVLSSEVYDPAARKWDHVANLAMGRYMFDAVKLGDGRALVVGGIRQNGPGFNVVSSSEIYNTTFNAWDTGPQMLEARYGLTADPLPYNEVLVAGGQNATNAFLNTSEVLEVDKGVSVKAPPMHTARSRHASLMNNHGNIIVSGGLTASGPTAKVESFAPGLKQDNMALDITGLAFVQSEGALSIRAHVSNDTVGDLQGAVVTFVSGGLGSFDTEAGNTDIWGNISTVFHAPRNSGAHAMPVTITVTADLWGYKEISKAFAVEVYPETRGEPMDFNQSITHLTYVTTYSSGSQSLSGSKVHSDLDYLGDDIVKVDGQPVMAANFSVSENAVQVLRVQEKNVVTTSALTGYYYFEYDLQGTVYSHMSKTTRAHTYNATYSKWENTTEVTETRYLPVMRGFNISIAQIGKAQDVVNTYQFTTVTTDLGTQKKTTVTGLRSEPKAYMYNGIGNLTTFMGVFQSRSFVDETGTVYDSYSTELGILLQELVYNDTGHLASTRSLLEYNSQIGEDPTDPLLEVALSVDTPTLEAGMSSAVHATVTVNALPVKGANITFYVGPGGTLSSTQALTDAKGVVNLTFAADHGGLTRAVNITAIATGTGYRTGIKRTVVTVVQDTSPPKIVHISVTEKEEDNPIEVYAMVTDDVRLSDVSLHYRIGFAGEYTVLPMELFLGSYMASVPASAVTPPLVEYYITAKDVNGNLRTVPDGAPDSPYNVTVIPRLRVLPPTSAILDPADYVTVVAAIRGNLTLTLSKVANPDNGPADSRFMGLFAELKAAGSGTLVWANISFYYSSSTLGYIDEGELKIYTWDAAGHSWSAIATTGVIPDKNVVWANVTHLTVFAPRSQNQPVIPPVQDLTPPSVSIVYPLPNAEVKGGITEVRGIASDNVGLDVIQVSTGSGDWKDVWYSSGAKSDVWYYNVTLGPGVHFITARARDKAGNVGNETVITVTVPPEKKTEEVSAKTVAGASAALLVVIFVILIMYIAGMMTEEKEKKPKKKDEEIEEDEEVGEEE